MSRERHTCAESGDNGCLWLNRADGSRANRRRTKRSYERMDTVPDAIDPRNLVREKLDEINGTRGDQHIRTRQHREARELWIERNQPETNPESNGENGRVKIQPRHQTEAHCRSE